MRLIADLLIILVMIGLLMVVIRYNRDADTVSGQARIVDGDTIRIDGNSIRLIGIDAPEQNQQCERSGETYPCGRLATRTLRGLMNRKKLTCRGWQFDIYDRLLAVCATAEQFKRGSSMNKEMVLAGWAVSSNDYPKEQAIAKAAKRGIWAGQFVDPADWRKDNKPQDQQIVGIAKSIWQWLKNIARF